LPSILSAADAPDEERHHFVANKLVNDGVVPQRNLST
jgi:hypothetical protein